MEGCDKPTQMTVWEFDEERFYNCPMKFISDSVAEWYENYSYDKEMGTAESYTDQSVRYIDARSYYMGRYSKYSQMKKPKNEPIMDPGQLHYMKKQFNKVHGRDAKK